MALLAERELDDAFAGEIGRRERLAFGADRHVVDFDPPAFDLPPGFARGLHKAYLDSGRENAIAVFEVRLGNL